MRENCRCAHHTFLLGFPTGWLAPPIKHFSGAVARDKEDFYKGSLSLPIFLLCYCFASFLYFNFACIFYQKYKKI
jgi:hypothetical protein